MGGCFQYFTGETGTIESYGLQSSQMIPTRTTACVSDQRRGSVVSSTPPPPGMCTVALSLMLLAMLLLLHVLLLELRQTSAPIRSAPVLRDAGRTMSSSPEQSLLASLRCRLPSPSYQPTLRMEMIDIVAQS